jgi:hypothetical protein
MTDEERAFVAVQIDQNLKSHLKAQKWWSFANSGSTILIVVFSAFAALFTQIKFPLLGFWIYGPSNNSLATMLSVAVTIISTIQTKLGFERKWVANRMTRSALQLLKLDESTGRDSGELLTTLKGILSKHDEAITGSSSSG